MSQIQTLLAARYGEAEAAFAAPWNETLAGLLSHRSIRAYSSRPLPEGTLESLVAAAQSAASSSNLQVWSVVAVESQERKQRLSALANNQAQVVHAPLFLVWLADFVRLRRIAAQRGLPAEGLDYLEMFLVGAIDAALAAQNAVVAAESQGLGTVYIGALRSHPLEVAAELGLPEGVFPLFGLCVGYADPAAAPAIKPRLAQSAVLHRETYRLDTQDEAVRRYDQVMAAFYAEQNMNTPGEWSQHSALRVSGPERLSGRDRLREALNALGFPVR